MPKVKDCGARMMNKKELFLNVSTGAIAAIVLLGLISHCINGFSQFNFFFPALVELDIAQINYERYNDDVRESLWIHHEGYKGNENFVFDGSKIFLDFTRLDLKRKYVLKETIRGGYTRSCAYFTNRTEQLILFIVNTTILHLDLCYYTYKYNQTSLEFFSLTYHYLIGIEFEWSF